MSNYRSSFSNAYGEGRVSPYTSGVGQNGRTMSDMFEYITPQESSQYRGGSEAPFEDDNAPDVIHVRYMARSFAVKFEPYAISESIVMVSHLRRQVAEALQHDPRRIRLVYKDKDLRRDSRPLKHYGCKQNSEVAVVVTETLYDYGTHESHSSEDDGAAIRRVPSTNERRHTRGMSSVRHRSGDDYVTPAPRGSTYLHPDGATARPHNSRRPSPSPAPQTRSPAPETRTAAPRPTASPVPPSSPPQSSNPPFRPRSPADPNSPMGKVQALQDLFYNKWRPETDAFFRSSNSDPQQRWKECVRLGEGIMKHVVEAADLIETQGDKTVRSERKSVIDAAQATIKDLDNLKKELEPYIKK